MGHSLRGHNLRIYFSVQWPYNYYWIILSLSALQEVVTFQPPSGQTGLYDMLGGQTIVDF